MMRLSKVLHEAKQRVRTWQYPLQRRLRLSLSSSASPRCAVMLFDPSARYGGWVDRVKGIVSTYELAKLSQRSFRLFAGPTFPLEDFLEPATFDWRTSPEDWTWNPLTAGFHVSRDRLGSAFVELRHSRRQNLFVDTNLDYLARLHPDRAPTELRALWRQRYLELFKTTARFSRELAEHVRPRAVAVHARFTELLGDFRDVTDNALDPQRRRNLLDECLERLSRLAKDQAGQDVILFSDSRTFLEAGAGVASNIIVLPGTPSHIDRTSTPREALQKTLLDFHVMYHCARIVQLRVGPMYPSNFSRYASYINDAEWVELG